MSSATPPARPDAVPPAEKVKQFPAAPGVYLMKDGQGRVLYVGKAKNLRNRAGHYFTKAAADDVRTADLVKLIADIDFLPAESEDRKSTRLNSSHSQISYAVFCLKK